MGLFELFRKQGEEERGLPEEAVVTGSSGDEAVANNREEEVDEVSVVADKSNLPMELTAKLLFTESPGIAKSVLLAELGKNYEHVEVKESTHSLTYSMMVTDSAGHKHPYECSILITDQMQVHPIPQEAFRQNWHWKEAAAVAKSCRFELLIIGKQNDSASYKTRAHVFIEFLSACIVATKPQVVYSKNAEKLLEPDDILACHTSVDPDLLHPLTNIRMFKVADSADGELLMGLTFNPNEPANLVMAGTLPDTTIAWQNRDGGFTVQLHSIPLSGRVVLRKPEKKD